MPKCRVFLAVLTATLSLLSSLTPAGAQRAPSDPERMAAARDLMAVVGTDKQLDGMFEAMAQGMRQGGQAAGNPASAERVQQDFDAFIQRFNGYRPQMLDEMAQLYAARFTAAELKTVADFYRSGTGAKFVAAMPQLMQAGGQVGMKYAQRIIEESKGSAALKR